MDLVESQQVAKQVVEEVADCDIVRKKNKRKEDKGVEQVMKSLQNLSSPEDKLVALCRKHAEALEETKAASSSLKNSQRALSQLAREKEQLQGDHSKAVLSRSKLESLCRELQKQNKLIKEESVSRMKEDDEKRKDISNKFQTTISEIQQQMDEHHHSNGNLRKENQQLAGKLNELCSKYEQREEHMEKVMKAKGLEGELWDAKMQQYQLSFNEEKEAWLKEKQHLLQEAMLSHKHIVLLEAQEKQYKGQVEAYSGKYEEFQGTLSKSNDVFNQFKNEMEKMTKKMKRLDKEASSWRLKSETSNKSLLLLADEKVKRQQEMAVLTLKCNKLEMLCRALQQERKKYISTPFNGRVGPATTETESSSTATTATTETESSSTATTSSTAMTTIAKTSEIESTAEKETETPATNEAGTNEEPSISSATTYETTLDAPEITAATTSIASTSPTTPPTTTPPTIPSTTTPPTTPSTTTPSTTTPPTTPSTTTPPTTPSTTTPPTTPSATTPPTTPHEPNNCEATK